MSQTIEELQKQLDKLKEKKSKLDDQTKEVQKKFSAAKKRERAMLAEQILKSIEDVLGYELSAEDAPKIDAYLKKYHITFAQEAGRQPQVHVGMPANSELKAEMNNQIEEFNSQI